MTAPSFDELKWVTQIRRTLDKEREGDDCSDDDDPISIFGVPKALISSYPNSYTPQQVALGPYHHWRPELYEMERYKLAAARRAQKHFLRRTLKFQALVDQVGSLERKIRGCYHKFLDFNGETLAWMMTMDASFLVEFLQVYAAVREGKILCRASSRMSHLVDYAGRRSAHNAILRDIVMLENQIPLFVLRKVLEFQHSSLESTEELLVSMSRGFCDEIFPFKMAEEVPGVLVSDAPHLLDLLYSMIVPKLDRTRSETISLDDDYEDSNNVFTKDSSCLTKFELLSRHLERLLCSKYVIFVLKLPWTIISRFPGISMLTVMCSPQEQLETKSETEKRSCNKAPLVEEIAIPAVTELSRSGVVFEPTSGGISTVGFDPQAVALRLPTVSLDVNSEVVLRNLVAYEAAGASGPLVFTRYTELMNGIIDTEDDARLLRERGIILNRLKSDREVADLWNGMSKSIRLTKVPLLDKAIEDVNKYYNGRFRVRAGRFMKHYVFGSWRLLTFFAAIALLLLMSIQAFCSIYNCRHRGVFGSLQ